jgi:hypothetical protein
MVVTTLGKPHRLEARHIHYRWTTPWLSFAVRHGKAGSGNTARASEGRTKTRKRFTINENSNN